LPRMLPSPNLCLFSWTSNMSECMLQCWR
jgi:hypothetical protein